MPGERECVDRLAHLAGDPKMALQETIALGLLVARKWDRTFGHGENSSPSSASAAAYDNFTASEMAEFRSAAGRMLDRFSTSQRAQPGWWVGFWQGYAAAFAYAVTLAIIAVIIKLNGSDAMTLLRSLFGNG